MAPTREWQWSWTEVDNSGHDSQVAVWEMGGSSYLWSRSLLGSVTEEHRLEVCVGKGVWGNQNVFLGYFM